MKLCRCGLLILVSLAACMPRPAPPVEPADSAEPAPRAMVEAKAVDWAQRDGAPLAWPANAESVELIITGGWDPGEHFVWLIANGSDVVGVFRAGARELDDVVDKATQMARAQISGGGRTGSFVMLGTIYVPGPPRPPHAIPGWPEEYARAIRDTARGAHRETSRLNQKARTQQQR